MALIYVCDYCKERYPVQSIGIKGQINYKIEGDTVGYYINDMSDACQACQEFSEKAKAEALEKRRKKV